MNRIIGGLAIVLALAAFPMTVLAGNVYKVSAKISHLGQEFAAPEIVVEIGAPASVEVTGEAPYSLEVDVVPLQDGTLKVSSKLKSRYGDMAPVVTVEPGGSASVSVGELSITLTAAPYSA